MNEKKGDLVFLDKARERKKFPAINKEIAEEPQMSGIKDEDPIGRNVFPENPERQNALAHESEKPGFQEEADKVLKDIREEKEKLKSNLAELKESYRLGKSNIQLSRESTYLEVRMKRLLDTIAIQEETYKHAMNRFHQVGGQLYKNDEKSRQDLERLEIATRAHSQLIAIHELALDMIEELNNAPKLLKTKADLVPDDK